MTTEAKEERQYACKHCGKTVHGLWDLLNHTHIEARSMTNDQGAVLERNEWTAAPVHEPWTRAKYEGNAAYIPELRKYFPTPPIEEVIRHNINWLIQSCYQPADDNESGRRARSGISDESINWGDLACVEVREYANGTWEAFIEEAAPEATEFCAWVGDWLRKWGWEVEVRTEW